MKQHRQSCKTERKSSKNTMFLTTTILRPIFQFPQSIHPQPDAFHYPQRPVGSLFSAEVGYKTNEILVPHTHTRQSHTLPCLSLEHLGRQNVVEVEVGEGFVQLLPHASNVNPIRLSHNNSPLPSLSWTPLSCLIVTRRPPLRYRS